MLRSLFALTLAASVAACGQASGGAGPVASAATQSDRSLGSPDAPVEIIEYASVMCSHCAHFHEDVWPALKEKYIETGKVRFVFREMPTPPVELAMAGFLLARCVPEPKYFDALDVLFDQQRALFDASRQPGGARDAYVTIAKRFGLDEPTFDACLADETEIARIRRVVDEAKFPDASGKEIDISSTPSFVINGKAVTNLSELDGKPLDFSIEDFDIHLAPLLGDD